MKFDLATEAHRITADLTKPRRAIYWADLLVTAIVAYGGLAVAVLGSGAFQILGLVVAVVALYRAMSFIHEVTHLRPHDVPGFVSAWNALIGVPFLVPSLLYEGVHNLHHAKHRYGTATDPEYLPFARRGIGASVALVAVALLAPVGTFLRFAVGTPLSLLVPRLREILVSRFSAMTINPAFRRSDLERARGASWQVQEIACWLWSWVLVGLLLSGGPRARAVLAGGGALCVVTVVNQLRTLVSHAWTSDGEPMSFTAQFSDTINVPPPAWLPAIWAPVGLRYHALHHLLPRSPYHHLGEAHRRLSQVLPAESVYHGVDQPGLVAALGDLAARRRRLA